MSDLKNLFTFELPYIGRVSMLFYIPECNERDMLESIIEKHGGRLTKFHECYTYQINPIYNEICARDFFIGNVYRATWLTDSIKAGEMLDNEEYLQKVVTESEKGVMRLELQKGAVSFTIVEAIKIEEIKVTNNNKSSANFWIDQCKQNVVPGRTSDSCRQFQKVQLKTGLKDYLEVQFTDKFIKFSHFFSEIPRPQDKGDTTREEKEYLRKAPPKLYNQNPSSNQRFETGIAPNLGMNVIDQYQQNMAAGAIRKSGAVSLSEISGVRKNDHDLSKIFGIIDQAKKLKNQAASNQDQEMINDCGDDKENDQFMLNKDELVDAIQQEQIIVFKKEEEKRQVQLTSGKEMYFALLAQDLMSLAEKYKRDIDEVHKIFFEVSCQRDQLVKILEGHKVNSKWGILEDLGLKDEPNQSSYQHVMKEKGQNEIDKRKQFLQMQ
eukprot:403348691